MLVSTMNASNEVNNSTSPPSSKPFPNSTIRSITPNSSKLETNLPDNQSCNDKTEDPMPHSTSSATSGRSRSFSPNKSTPVDIRLPIYVSNSTIPNGINKNVQKQVSTEFGPTVAFAGSNGNLSNLSSPEEKISSSGSSVSQWNSAVGRAGLGGKSGRVIERLMGDNDMLKRDLQIERLRAEEQRQAVKLVEGKMETLVAEYDTKLHDAAINKTLLKRKERQLADLLLQIGLEKTKANLAIENERVWKKEIEKVENEAKQHVEDAMTYASMMEARNNVMTNHWKDQGLEVNQAVDKISKEIQEITLERKQDDERINMLQNLCDQQATQLAGIVEERNAIVNKYEQYKRTQEEILQDIKESAKKQEEKTECLLAETLKALNELKWALGVKKSERNLLSEATSASTSYISQ